MNSLVDDGSLIGYVSGSVGSVWEFMGYGREWVGEQEAGR